MAKIGPEAVKKATGKSFDEWFRILDRWKAAEKTHKAIAAWLEDEKGLSGWWAQTVTVEYERARGLRDHGERPGKGYEVSVRRTIAATPERVWAGLTESKELNRWFTKRAKVALEVGGKYSNQDGDRGTFEKIVPRRLLRFTWDNPGRYPGTRVEIAIESKGEDKSVVGLVHSKLPDRAGREEMKTRWSRALDDLKTWLERGEKNSR